MMGRAQNGEHTEGTQAVPQVQFQHGNVILKHSGSRLTRQKKGRDEPKPKPEKISERTKEEAESNVIMGQ